MLACALLEDYAALYFFCYFLSLCSFKGKYLFQYQLKIQELTSNASAKLELKIKNSIKSVKRKRFHFIR